MTDVTQGIPAAPREPRWRACAARNWVLGLIGGLLLVYGAILGVVMIQSKDDVQLQIAVGLMLGPGIGLFGWWLRSMFRIRVMMREGTCTTGEVVRAKITRGVNPPQVHVRYTFVDEKGGSNTGAHYVRARSALGQRLLAGTAGDQPMNVPVLYDPWAPVVNRVVGPEDFVPTSLARGDLDREMLS